MNLFHQQIDYANAYSEIFGKEIRYMNLHYIFRVRLEQYLN